MLIQRKNFWWNTDYLNSTFKVKCHIDLYKDISFVCSNCTNMTFSFLLASLRIGSRCVCTFLFSKFMASEQYAISILQLWVSSSLKLASRHRPPGCDQFVMFIMFLYVMVFSVWSTVQMRQDLCEARTWKGLKARIDHSSIQDVIVQNVTGLTILADSHQGNYDGDRYYLHFWLFSFLSIPLNHMVNEGTDFGLLILRRPDIVGGQQKYILNNSNKINWMKLPWIWWEIFIW